MPLNRVQYISVIVLILLIAGAVAFLYYKKNEANTIQINELEMSMFKKQYEGAKIKHFSGDYSIAIDDYKRLLDRAPDKAAEGKLKILIAGSLFLRNENDDRVRSIKMYKSVINDYKIPPYVRALALNDIASLVIGQNEAFYELYFPEAPFNSYLSDSKTSASRVSAAYLKILELSDETYPNSYAEYAIAGNYYTPLLVNSKLEGIDSAQIARKIQDYIKRGDSQSDEGIYSTFLVLRGLLYRATALNASNRVLDNVPREQREESFRLIFQKWSPYESTNDSFSHFTVMKARFFYANFLLESFGLERLEDIKELLKPYATAVYGLDLASELTRNYFAEFKSGERFITISALRLAEASPEFREFLINVGFTVR